PRALKATGSQASRGGATRTARAARTSSRPPPRPSRQTFSCLLALRHHACPGALQCATEGSIAAAVRDRHGSDAALDGFAACDELDPHAAARLHASRPVPDDQRRDDASLVDGVDEDARGSREEDEMIGAKRDG